MRRGSVFANIEDALSVIKKPADEAQYLAACEYLVQNRSSLTYPVYINFPGGLISNADTRWDGIKAGSEERCGCGNERVINPGNPRTVYEPSSLGFVVVSQGHNVYLKPVGGDKESTYMKLWIQEGALAYMDLPFAPLVMTMDLFSTPAFKLDRLAEVLPKQSKPPVMRMGNKTPVFAINSVDLSAQSVTITPDRGVEIFNPDTYVDAHASHKGTK